MRWLSTGTFHVLDTTSSGVWPRCQRNRRSCIAQVTMYTLYTCSDGGELVVRPLVALCQCTLGVVAGVGI